MTAGQDAALSKLFSTGMGTAGGISNILMNLGAGSAGRIADYDKAVTDFGSVAGTDRTSGILNNASQYADNPYLQGQIDAALGDVRKAFDRSVGDINSGAVGTGNINSTRAGALEAMAADDAMDRAAGISSSMRGAAYESGLDRAMLSDSQRMQELMSNAGLLKDVGQTGVDMLTGGLGVGMQGAETALNAETIRQQQAQSEIEGRLRQAEIPLDLVAKYMGIVGQNFGSEGYTSTVQKSASPFQQILGGVTSLAGAGFNLPFMK